MHIDLYMCVHKRLLIQDWKQNEGIVKIVIIFRMKYYAKVKNYKVIFNDMAIYL